jgi:DNA-binding CsgD family transcriptional regulator
MFARRAAPQVLAFQGASLATREQPAPAQPAAAAGADVNAVCLGLTARQRDVLALLVQGKSNKGICRVLNLAEPTVKNHVTAILKSLGVSNRIEAVIKVSGAAVALLSFASTISGYQAFGTSQASQAPAGQMPAARYAGTWNVVPVPAINVVQQRTNEPLSARRAAGYKNTA